MTKTDGDYLWPWEPCVNFLKKSQCILQKNFWKSIESELVNKITFVNMGWKINGLKFGLSHHFFYNLSWLIFFRISFNLTKNPLRSIYPVHYRSLMLYSKSLRLMWVLLRQIDQRINIHTKVTKNSKFMGHEILLNIRFFL